MPYINRRQKLPTRFYDNTTRDISNLNLTLIVEEQGNNTSVDITIDELGSHSDTSFNSSSRGPVSALTAISSNAVSSTTFDGTSTSPAKKSSTTMMTSMTNTPTSTFLTYPSSDMTSTALNMAQSTIASELSSSTSMTLVSTTLPALTLPINLTGPSNSTLDTTATLSLILVIVRTIFGSG